MTINAGGINCDPRSTTEIYNELSAEIAAIGQPPNAATRGTYLVSGGKLIYSGSGYVYTITGGSGYIDGALITWTQQDVTLDAAHATLDRIDVFVVNGSGIVSATKGTAAATPSKPDIDPALYLELTFAIVYANTATPTNTTTTNLYTENAGTPTEWAATTSSAATVDIDSTTDPRAGTYCIRAVSATAGTTITLTAASAIDPSTKDVFSMFIKLLTAWNTKASLTLQFYLSTVKKGNAITIKPGENGLVASNTSTYQGQAFLIQQFAFPSSTTIDKLVITVTGATISFALDDIQLQDFGGDVTVINQSGITQSEADARYAPISSKTRQLTYPINGALTTQSGSTRVPNRLGYSASITSVYLDVNGAPTGSSLIVDIHKSGSTLFTSASYRPVITTGCYNGSSVTVENALWTVGQYLTFDIDQIGASESGSDLSVTVVFI